MKKASIFILTVLFTCISLALFNTDAQAAVSSGISLSPRIVTLEEGETAYITLNGVSSSKSVSWSSSSSNLVVQNFGNACKVTLVSKPSGVSGVAGSVTAKYNGKSYTCTVNYKLIERSRTSITPRYRKSTGNSSDSFLSGENWLKAKTLSLIKTDENDKKEIDGVTEVFQKGYKGPYYSYTYAGGIYNSGRYYTCANGFGSIAYSSADGYHAFGDAMIQSWNLYGVFTGCYSAGWHFADLGNDSYATIYYGYSSDRSEFLPMQICVYNKDGSKEKYDYTGMSNWCYQFDYIKYNKSGKKVTSSKLHSEQIAHAE